MTALQLATAFSALANGGILMRPYLIKAIIKNGEVIQETAPAEGVASFQSQLRVRLPTSCRGGHTGERSSSGGGWLYGSRQDWDSTEV